VSNRHIPGFNQGEALPSVTGYTVRITNGFTEPLHAVQVLIARADKERAIQTVSPLPPGMWAAVPVGTMQDFRSYSICAYDAQGHAIAVLPPGGGTITPAEAASALPFRPDAHTDDWTFEPAGMLDLTAHYALTVVNNSPDVWDEVTVAYASATDGTVLLASSAVDPQGRVQFDLGPAGAMDGYVFSVWVNGLRAELAPDALQFPPEGLMTARRAAELKSNFGLYADVWEIG
jgi:hypothetical protein